MSWIVVAVLAVVASTVSVFVDRRMRARKALAAKTEEQPVAEQPGLDPEPIKAEVAQPVAGNVFGNAYTALRSRLISSKPNVVQQFQTWAETHIDDPQLKAWIVGFSPATAAALVEQLAAFCVNLGFELPWLLNNELQNDPEIEQQARSVVIAYCTACRNAAQGYNDFEVFKLVRKIEQEPFTREYKDLSRRLFAELVKRDLAPSVPTELFLATEKERQDHMTNAIRGAASTNRATFKIVLKEVMTTTVETVAPVSEAAPAEAVAPSEEAPAKKRGIFGRKKAEAQAPVEPEIPVPASDGAMPEPSPSY